MEDGPVIDPWAIVILSLPGLTMVYYFIKHIYDLFQKWSKSPLETSLSVEDGYAKLDLEEHWRSDEVENKWKFESADALLNPTAISFGSFLDMDFDESLSLFNKLISLKNWEEIKYIDISGKYAVSNNNSILKIDDSSTKNYSREVQNNILSNGAQVLVGVFSEDYYDYISVMDLEGEKEEIINCGMSIGSLDISSDNKFLLICGNIFVKKDDYDKIVPNSHYSENGDNYDSDYDDEDTIGEHDEANADENNYDDYESRYYTRIWDLEKNEEYISQRVDYEYKTMFTAQNRILRITGGDLELLEFTEYGFTTIKKYNLPIWANKVVMSPEGKFIICENENTRYLLDVEREKNAKMIMNFSHYILDDNQIAYLLDSDIIVEKLDDIIKEIDITDILGKYSWDDEDIDQIESLVTSSLSKLCSPIKISFRFNKDQNYYLFSVDLSNQELTDDDIPSITSAIHKLEDYCLINPDKISFDYIKLDHNSFSHLPDFSKFSWLLFDAGYNKIEKISTALNSRCILLNNNQISNIDLNLFTSEEINLSNNKITSTQIPNQLNYFSFKEINLDNNKIERISEIFNLFEYGNLLYISILGNELEGTIQESVFVNNIGKTSGISFKDYVIQELNEKFLFAFIQEHRIVYKGKYPINEIHRYIYKVWDTQKLIPSILIDYHQDMITDTIVKLIQSGRLIARIEYHHLILEKDILELI